MSPELMTAIGVIILGVVTAFFGFIKYVFDKLIKEIKPNGGKSLKDQVTRLEQRVDDIYNILLSDHSKRRTKRKNESN